MPKKRTHKHLTSFQIIILGFLSIIITGCLFLIQIGGMGIITAAVSFAAVSGRKIVLMQRKTMQNLNSYIIAIKHNGIMQMNVTPQTIL